MRTPAQFLPKSRKWKPGRFIFDGKAIRRGELDSDPRKVLRSLGGWIKPLAAGRIMDYNAFPSNRF
jgi:hypothetical protein